MSRYFKNRLCNSIPRYFNGSIRITLTKPITTASSDRGFSKHKSIKNYLWSTMDRQTRPELTVLYLLKKKFVKI